MFLPFKDSHLRVHIAFHFIEKRLTYLEQVLATLNTYEFNEVSIVVDTNREDTKALLTIPALQSQVSLDFSVHTNLEDPYLLTWTHRNQMEKQLNRYDYFMYLEDDIVVPFRALKRWRIESSWLYPKNYFRGFLRVERDADNGFVCTDQVKFPSKRHYVSLKKQMFLRPPSPYQAFWIYDRGQMKTFVKSIAWKNGNIKGWGIRERAAAGMAWINRHKYKTLIPLTSDFGIPDDVLVEHIANNYAADPDSPLGKIAIEGFVNPEKAKKGKNIFNKLLQHLS